MKHFVTMMVIVVALVTGCTPPSTNTPITTTSPPEPITQPSPLNPTEPTPEESTAMSEEMLSPELQKAILDAVSAEQKVPVDQLSITVIQAADWPDSCLGLAGPDEMCAQMITPGWALTITDGQQTWQYRTDLDAVQLKLEAS